MTTKEAKTIKIGDLVTPVYGFDKDVVHVVSKIWINPYRTNTLEIQITAVPIKPEQVQSDWKVHGLRRCNQQGWKLLSAENIGGKEI